MAFKVYLLEIEPSRRIDGDPWTQHNIFTKCWWVNYTESEPSRIEEDGSKYTGRASLQLCHDNLSSWYWDSANNRLYLHTPGSDDPGGRGHIIPSYFWEYFTNRSPTIFNGHNYTPFFLSLAKLSLLGKPNIFILVCQVFICEYWN